MITISSWRIALASLLGLALLATSVGIAAASLPPPPPFIDPTVATANTPVTFYYGLVRREGAAAAEFRRVADYTSPGYTRYPDRAAIRERFGASKSTVRTLRRSAAPFGLKTTLDATGVFARVSGTAGQMGDWLGSPVMVGTSPINPSVRIYTSSGVVPTNARRAVVEQVPFWVPSRGTNSSSADWPRKKKRQKVVAAAQLLPPNGGRFGPACPSLKRWAKYTYSFRQFQTGYANRSAEAGATVGRRAHLAIVGRNYSTVAQQRAKACLRLPAHRFARINTDGVSGYMAPDTESNLDIQQAQGVLPADSRISMIRAVEIPQVFFLMWSRVFSMPEMPDVVSASLGICEALVDPWGFNRTLVDSVALRLSIAGVSSIAASGDSGSSTCDNFGYSALNTSYPASSPYFAAVGGTRMTFKADNRRKSEVVWNDSNLSIRTIDGLLTGGGAGGGGPSQLYPRPWWQKGTGQSMRAVPDVAAQSSFGYVWPVWLDDPPGWSTAGNGTSSAAPYVAAAYATFAAEERLAGRRAPIAGPALYAAVARTRAAVFDVTKGNNDLRDVGCCTAKRNYDMASGLGVPRFSVLFQAIRELDQYGK